MDLSRAPVELLRSLSPLISRVRRQVHYGANALELCYLAEGRIDAFVDIRRKMRITDFAAGCLIATEAGASMTDETGRVLRWKLDLSDRAACVASANARLHDQILKLLAPSR
jgi:myo-inositol-1(or 4)-monophosphatase